jgi:hypothetical protein
MEGVLLPWVIASTILLFIAAYWIYTLERRVKGLESRYERVLALAESDDEATVAKLLQRLDDQGGRLDGVEASVATLRAVLPRALQGYGIVRYQAFPNVGGDQSFSLALVDGRGNGSLLSSLHGRDETRVYAKAIQGWRSSHSLSAEEQEALGQARKMVEGET